MQSQPQTGETLYKRTDKYEIRTNLSLRLMNAGITLSLTVIVSDMISAMYPCEEYNKKYIWLPLDR